MKEKRKKQSGPDIVALLILGGAGWLGWRFLFRKDATAPTPSQNAPEAPQNAADLLRRLVFYDGPMDGPGGRLALLAQYQWAENVRPTGRWDSATEAAAERRLSSFISSVRPALVAAMAADPFFRAGEIASP